MTNALRPRPGKNATAGREYPVAILHSVEDSIRADLREYFRSAVGFTEAARFKISYLEKEIFSKYLNPSVKGGAEARKAGAVGKWLSAERRNEKTNVRLTIDEAHFAKSRCGRQTVSSQVILDTARRFVTDVIGESPWVGPQGPSLEILAGTFTSGASTLFNRQDGLLARKFMEEAHTTSSALPYVQLLRTWMQGWTSLSDEMRGKPLSIELVRGSVLFTVPKTAEIDRCACKEPGLNMFLQKGVGEFIRSRLRSVIRLDLSDQTLNQRLAREGSLGGLATLDLSSASDTISLALVFNLLPSEWFHYLNAIRSRECFVNGEWVELSMFSSMGNAFTFELETLIFWALASACKFHLGVSGAVSVYGDDIIVPDSVAGFIARFFAYVGFTVNPKKSFWRGPFRESCGKHWYKGIDVTPFYVRQPINDITRLIHFLNRLRKWLDDGSGFLDSHGYALWAKYAATVPRRLRGGFDLESITQLVSDEKPEDRLVPILRQQKDRSVEGEYLHWLRAASFRADGPGVARGSRNRPILVREALITSLERVATSRYAVQKSVADGTHGRLLFLEELIPGDRIAV